MRTGYRCIGFVLMAFCAAGQVSTQAVYDAGQNLIWNMAGSASNPYEDGNGGLWTYGRAANAYHASVQTFTHTYRENGLSGFLDTDSFGVPLVMVNTTGQELTRTDIGSLPIGRGEIVTHPASVSQSPYCTIVRFTVPHSSIYEATVAAHDITPNGDGALISLAVNGKVFQEECLNISDAIASKTLRLNAHYLPKGSTIDYSGLGCSPSTVFKVGDDAHFGNELKCFTTSGDYAFFPKVSADAAGCITGSFYCTESFGNIAGFQLMGRFPLPPSGTVIRLL